MPNYLVSASDDAVVLRNYEGMLVRYQAEDKPSTVQSARTRGVSALLNGGKTLLMPEGDERMARRQLHVLGPREQDPSPGKADSLLDLSPRIDGEGVLASWHEE
jgi:lysine 2,3-aminomutase